MFLKTAGRNYRVDVQIRIDNVLSVDVVIVDNRLAQLLHQMSRYLPHFGPLFQDEHSTNHNHGRSQNSDPDGNIQITYTYTLTVNHRI